MAGAVLAVLNAAENEGLAVGAQTHSRVLFVSTYADLFKSAVALAGGVSALSNGACNAMIVLLFHSNTKPFAKSKIDRLSISSKVLCPVLKKRCVRKMPKFAHLCHFG